VAPHYYAGEPHAFQVMFWRENAIRCWRASFEFLQRHLPVKAWSTLPACGLGAVTALPPAQPMRDGRLANRC